MTRPIITNDQVCDLYDTANRLRRLVCSMFFLGHDAERRQALFLEALEELERLDDQIGPVGNASVVVEEAEVTQ